MSIDTGMSGNLFGVDYFTMNKDHLSGQLQKMDIRFSKLMKPDSNNYVLKIHPITKKKKRIIRGLEE